MVLDLHSGENSLNFSPEERMLMGFDMMATARELAWAGLAHPKSETVSDEDQRLFYQRFHHSPRPW